MGRRSSETAYSANRYRRLLIDTLIDEYGPNLLQALEVSKYSYRIKQLIGHWLNRTTVLSGNQIQARAAGSSKVVEQDLPGGEVAYRNEQPFDWKRSSEDEATETRDERSDSGRDSSLAMRALNANRYIQYLTSGQPLMSYSRLFGTQEGDTAANGRDTIARENQNRLFANDR